jgi:hypothetical protein
MEIKYVMTPLILHSLCHLFVCRQFVYGPSPAHVIAITAKSVSGDSWARFCDDSSDTLIAMIFFNPVGHIHTQHNPTL